MKKIFLNALIAVFCLVGLYPLPAYAEKVLFLTPTRILLNDEKKVEVMNITNLSNIARAYKISLQDQVMIEKGYTVPVDSFEFSAKRMLRFVPREFVLEPGDRQTIRIMSRLKPNTPAGEYHTHIKFSEDVSQRHKINPPKPDQQVSISAPLAYETLIPAVISHGDVNVSIGVKDAKILKNPKTGKYEVSMYLTREGNGQGIAYLDTYYVAPDGTSAVVTPRRTVYLYREISERIKKYDFTIPAELASGGIIKLSVFDKADKEAATVTELTLSLP